MLHQGSEDKNIQLKPQGEPLGPILIVDDDKDDQFLLGRTMKTLFGEVSIRTFNDGMQMLEYLNQTNGAEGKRQKPRLILMDIHMPSIDGIKLLRKMREELGYTDIPVVIVSNTIDSEMVELAYQAGANAFLSKRFSRLDFIEAIHRDERLGCVH